MVRRTSTVTAICPECGGKRGFHMAECTAADTRLQRMRAVRDRLEALGISPDDLIDFIDICSAKNNFQ